MAVASQSIPATGELSRRLKSLKIDLNRHLHHFVKWGAFITKDKQCLSEEKGTVSFALPLTDPKKADGMNGNELDCDRCQCLLDKAREIAEAAKDRFVTYDLLLANCNSYTSEIINSCDLDVAGLGWNLRSNVFFPQVPGWGQKFSG